MYVVVIVAVSVVLIVMFLDMVGTDAMPFRCPRCGFGGDEDFAGQHQLWYARLVGRRSKCRTCHTVFKEHPNGSLVEDR